MNTTNNLEAVYLAALSRLKAATTEEQRRAISWDIAHAWQRLEEAKAHALYARGLPEDSEPNNEQHTTNYRGLRMPKM